MSGDRLTLQENLAILKPSQKGGLPLPPIMFHTLQKMLTTNVRKLWTLWGRRYVHYVAVMTVIKILYQEEVDSSADDFTPMLCV